MKSNGWNSKLLDEYTRSQGWIDIQQAYGDGRLSMHQLFTWEVLSIPKGWPRLVPGIGLVVVVLQGLER